MNSVPVAWYIRTRGHTVAVGQPLPGTRVRSWFAACDWKRHGPHGRAAMTVYGADVDALDALARQMLSAAEHLEATRVSVRSLLYNVQWIGEDGQAFRSEWDGPHSARLAAATAIIRNA